MAKCYLCVAIDTTREIPVVIGVDTYSESANELTRTGNGVEYSLLYESHEHSYYHDAVEEVIQTIKFTHIFKWVRKYFKDYSFV